MYSITSCNISSGISLYDFPNFFFTQIATCAYGFLPLGWCLEGGSFPTNIPPASCIYDQISLEFASFTPSISLGTFAILQTTMLAVSASILYQTIVLELPPEDKARPARLNIAWTRIEQGPQNEGIIPRMRIINASSLITAVLGGRIGNLGAIGFGSLVSLLTTLTICSVSESAGRYLGIASLPLHSLQTISLEFL